MPYSYLGSKGKGTSHIFLRGIEPTALAQGAHWRQNRKRIAQDHRPYINLCLILDLIQHCQIRTKNLFHKAKLCQTHSLKVVKQNSGLEKMFRDPGNYVVFFCSNMLLFHTLPLYIFSLFSTYAVLILRKRGEIHSRFQVFQCETEIISHFEEITLSITVPTRFLISCALSNNPRHQIFNLLILICHRLPFFLVSNLIIVKL